MNDFKFSKDTWGGIVEVTFVTHLDVKLPITAVSCIAVTSLEKNIVLTKIPRGIDLPGGHLENNELPIEALYRELHEEIGAVPIAVDLLGYRIMKKIIHARNIEKYPEHSAIAMYIASVSIESDLKPLKEAEGRILIKPASVASVHHHWSDQEREIFDYAMSEFPGYFI